MNILEVGKMNKKIITSEFYKKYMRNTKESNFVQTCILLEYIESKEEELENLKKIIKKKNKQINDQKHYYLQKIKELRRRK